MSWDQHEFCSELDESQCRPASVGAPNPTIAASDVIEIELVQEWLPRDPAHAAEAIVIMLFVMFGCGLAVWVMASLH